MRQTCQLPPAKAGGLCFYYAATIGLGRLFLCMRLVVLRTNT